MVDGNFRSWTLDIKVIIIKIMNINICWMYKSVGKYYVEMKRIPKYLYICIYCGNKESLLNDYFVYVHFCCKDNFQLKQKHHNAYKKIYVSKYWHSWWTEQYFFRITIQITFTFNHELPYLGKNDSYKETNEKWAEENDFIIYNITVQRLVDVNAKCHSNWQKPIQMGRQ